MWAAVVAVSALGMYLAESGENPNVRDIWDALWWAVVTITTVGYGDVSPTTAEGRLAAAVLMVLGITFFSFLTATFTAALTSTSTSETVNLEARMKTLKRLRTKKLISAKEYESTKRRYLAQ
jgi:voltage-gated potassium channel